MIKRLFAIGLFLIGTSAFAVGLTDTARSPHRDAIQILLDHGIVRGYADGTFRPDVAINRAEFLKILMLAVYGDTVFDVRDRRCFSDFVSTERWYYAHACSAKQRGILNGYPDGTFRGEQTVNLAEALKMSLEAWEVPLPQYFRAPDHWYDPYIDTANGRNIFSVIAKDPSHLLTRGEAAGLLVALGEPIGSVVQDQDPFIDEPSPSIEPPISPDAGECGDGVLDDGEQCDDGNVENGDGCSKICIRVAEPVRHGALRIELRPSSSVSLTRGSRDVVLLAFDAIAGRQDVFLSQLKFAAGGGSLDSAEHYRLYVDRNGDGKAEFMAATAVPNGDMLAFSPLRIGVRDGRATRVELRADIRTSGSVGDFSIGFATDEPDYIEGIDAVDGEDVTGIETDDNGCQQEDICWIAVYTQAAREVLVTDTGNLYVTEDSTPVRSHQLLLGQRSDPLLRLNFRSTGEDIEVTSITIGGASRSADTLELYQEGGSEPFAVARNSICDAPATGKFCVETAFVIPRDSSRDVIVRAMMKSDEAGGQSGDVVSLSVAASGVPGAIEARGRESLIDLAINDGDGTAEGEIFLGRETPGVNSAIVGETHDVVGAKILAIENTSADADDTPVPSGTTTIGQFRFRAAPHDNAREGLNNVTIHDLVFSVVATSVLMNQDAFALYNANNSSVQEACTASATTGVITVTCADLEDEVIGSVIEQGGFIDLGLRAEVLNPQVGNGNAVLQVQIKDLGDRNDTGSVIWDDDVQTLQWVDLSESTVRSVRYDND